MEGREWSRKAVRRLQQSSSLKMTVVDEMERSEELVVGLKMELPWKQYTCPSTSEWIKKVFMDIF